jgi:hypothetical protein
MRLLRCEVCGRPFVAGGQPIRYCSARCRNTAVKRAYRGRRRERAADGPDGRAETEEDDRVEQGA